MFVHSCCCIGIFVSSGLIQIQNRIQNHLKMLSNIWKGKRKGILFSSRFSAQLTRSPPSPAARLLSRAWSSLAFPRLGRAQQVPSLAQQLARARAAVSLSACHWRRGPACRTTPSSSPYRANFLPRFTDRILPSQSFFPCLEHLRVIKTGCRTPPLHLTSKQRTDVVPRRPRSSRSWSRSPSRAPHRLRADSVFGSYLGELALFPTLSWCFSFVR
jgi:hypothetical protein